MFERLEKCAMQRAEILRREAITHLAQSPLPSGIHAEATDDGIRLSGKRLRRRMIDDPILRNFGR